MTPAERSLLIAVAKRFARTTRVDPGLMIAIAAVEAEDKPWINARVGREAAPDPMRSTLDAFGKILHAAAHDPEPLTEADVCPTCHGDGDIDDGSLAGKQCPDCGKAAQ